MLKIMVVSYSFICQHFLAFFIPVREILQINGAVTLMHVIISVTFQFSNSSLSVKYARNVNDWQFLTCTDHNSFFLNKQKCAHAVHLVCSHTGLFNTNTHTHDYQRNQCQLQSLQVRTSHTCVQV